MAANKGNFVVIKAGDCGPCQALTKFLPDIAKRLKAEGYELIVYEVAKRWEQPNGRYPDVLGVPSWYPFGFYVDNKTLEELKAGKDVRDKMVIFSGQFLKDKGMYNLDRESGLNMYDANAIADWIKQVATNAGTTDRPMITNQAVMSNQNVRSSDNKPTGPDFCQLRIVPRKKRK